MLSIVSTLPPIPYAVAVLAVAPVGTLILAAVAGMLPAIVPAYRRSGQARRVAALRRRQGVR